MSSWAWRKITAVAIIGLGLYAILPEPVSASPVRRQTLHVFAAASLAQAFGELARRFEVAHPSVRVQLNLAGSQQLAAQIEQGAPADVLALADERWMDVLMSHGRIDGGAALFAHNRLVVITPRADPGQMTRLQDLARRGTKLVLCADAVPAGHYSRQLLSRLSRCRGFDPAFARRVLANVVSDEENVKAVVGKVQLGEADAGICYQSDVVGTVSPSLRVWTIPECASVVASYPIAVVAGARQPGLARGFLNLVQSHEGQRILEQSGLVSSKSAPEPAGME